MVLVKAGPIALGKTSTVLSTDSSIAGVESREFSIESDSVLVSLWVDSVGGDLDVKVYTLTDTGKELEVISFPTISAPTTELLLKKAAATMSRIRVEATYSGAATFEIKAKGINAGQTAVSISGAVTFQVSQEDVTTTATILIPASLVDREGLEIINNSTTSVLYLAEVIGKATTAVGYPVKPGGSFAIDLASGVEIYAVADTGTVDVRIAEAGG